MYSVHGSVGLQCVSVCVRVCVRVRVHVCVCMCMHAGMCVSTSTIKNEG